MKIAPATFFKRTTGLVLLQELATTFCRETKSSSSNLARLVEVRIRGPAPADWGQGVYNEYLQFYEC
jgi:hypothetical protein